jgi:hypothetical protein
MVMFLDKTVLTRKGLPNSYVKFSLIADEEICENSI